MTVAATAQKPAMPAPWWDAAEIGHVLRARMRLTSAVILLSFVVCHLVSHIFLLVSIPLASRVLGFLMAFWWTETGAVLLAIALLTHFLNALWSIYVRRSLRLSRWEWAQITLGLAIVPLMIRHVVTTLDRFGISACQQRLQLCAVISLGAGAEVPAVPYRGGSDRVGARLDRNSFLAAYEEMVPHLAGSVCDRRIIDPDARDRRIHRGW